MIPFGRLSAAEGEAPMRLGNSSARLNATGCIILPASLFIGLMIASAGVAIWPRVAAPGAALICSGEVVYESHGASYRPGEYTVTRTLYCETGEGKNATRDDITLQAAGLSFLLYSAIAFLLLRFVAAPLLRRRAARMIEAGRNAAPAVFGTPAEPVDLRDILARVSDAVERGEANVVVRNATYDISDGAAAGGGADGDGFAERLVRLRELRDQGLISAEDYETKKAEILSRL